MSTQIDKLRDQFYDQGYLILPSVLSVQECEELKEDVRKIAEETATGKLRRVNIYKRMNYQMPQEVVDLASTDPRLKRLVGFLGSGPYG